MHISRVAEYPRPDHVLFHFSDTHLIAGDDELYGAVDAEHRLRQLLAQAEASRITPTAIVFTGDLTDHGEPDAYGKLRALVEPFAQRLGAPVVWVTGNHDSRAALREHLLDEEGSAEPFDRVHIFDGLRVVVLDTTVPGHHYGEISEAQLAWLRSVLAE
ncbi:metallophosphoesterase, partial [Nocardia gipuzkoensis]